VLGDKMMNCSFHH